MTAKKQNGGEFSRRDAMRALMNNGYSRRDARRTIRGVGGSELQKNDITPKAIFASSPVQLTTPQVLSQPAALVELKKPEPEKKLTFNEAFAKARKSGLDVFEWNGKMYNTRISDSRPYIETAIDSMGRYGEQARPYWEVAAAGLSRK